MRMLICVLLPLPMQAAQAVPVRRAHDLLRPVEDCGTVRGACSCSVSWAAGHGTGSCEV